MDWKIELESLLVKHHTDSDIEDFVAVHPEVNSKDIWDYVYEREAPDSCKGCGNIQRSGTFPCNRCSRKIKVEDYYESR